MPHQRGAELVELVVVQAELIQTFTARVAEPERPPRRGFVELKRVRRVVGFAVEQETRRATNHTGRISRLTRCHASVPKHEDQVPETMSPFIKGVSLMPTPTNAAPNGGATDAAAGPVTESVAAAFPQTSTVAGDILARSTRALTSIVQSAAGKARELSDGVAAEFKKLAGLPALDPHHRPGLHLGDPTAWV